MRFSVNGSRTYLFLYHIIEISHALFDRGYDDSLSHRMLLKLKAILGVSALLCGKVALYLVAKHSPPDVSFLNCEAMRWSEIRPHSIDL